ncbi:glycosyltransferase family 39 protein [Lyngbya aestuarii]|uniref:glycosyltransferase family 39 protein n=1 Tax=Lyngbya aestuarii TaxID=118322 RepID=UPI00403D5CBE
MKFKVDRRLRRCAEYNRTVKSWWQWGEQQPTIAWTLSIFWLLMISWLAFLWHLGSTGLVDETEPLFAEAARQMTVTGDWITPYFNGETRFDKPPLVYWLMALGYQIIGVNEWAVRLPSALAAIALTVLGFYTLRFLGVSRPAAVVPLEDAGLENDTSTPASLQHQLWLSAGMGSAMIALNPQTVVWGRTGVSDMLLSGCMGCALLAFFLGYAQPQEAQGKYFWSSVKNRWYLAFYLLIALAILTKGPVGIVLPMLIIGAFLFYLGKVREVLREMQVLRGCLLMLVITLPWYVLVTIANGEDYIDSFFGYHNFQRFTEVVNGHDAPWYFYFLVVLVGFAPWSIYLPAAITRLRFWQRDHWQSSPRSTQLGLFALFWFAGVFGFFTISVTKLPSYVLPLMPAASILVALLWSDQITRGKGQQRFPVLLLSGLFNVVFLLAIAAAMFYSPHLVGYDPAALDLSERLQQSGLPWQGALIWGATAVITGLLLLRRRWWSWLWSANFVGFLAFVVFVVTPVSFLIDQDRQLPLRQLSLLAAQVEQPQEELLMIGFKKPSVVFYSQKPVNYFARQTSATAHIEELAATESQPFSVLLLSQSEKLKKSKLQPNQYKNLGSVGAYELIRLTIKPRQEG